MRFPLLCVLQPGRGWSQNARFYTLSQAISLVGASLVLRGLASGSAARTVIGLAIAAGLGVGGAFVDQSFNVPSAAPAPSNVRKDAKVANTMAHFIGLRILSRGPAPSA